MSENYNIPIEEIDFSTRTHNCLKRANINYLSELMEMDEEKLYAISNMGKKSVNEVIELISLVKKEEIKFENKEEKNEKPSIADWDMELKDGNFSVRSYNALEKIGAVYFSEIIEKSKEEIEEIRNLGKASVIEILNKIYTYEVKIADKNDDIENKYQYFDFLEIADECSNVYGIKKDHVLCLLAKINRDDSNASKETVLSSLYKTKMVKKALYSKVFGIIKDSEDGVTTEEIQSKLPKHLINTNILEEIIAEQKRKEEIKESKGRHYAKYMTAREYAQILNDERHQRILNMRLDGKTLQECGDEFGITRERARQICEKIFDRRPRLEEDRYIYYFDKYEFDKENFCFIFEENEDAFYYLEAISNRKIEDLLPVEEIINDTKASNDIKKQVEKWNYRDCIMINGYPLLKNRQRFFRYIVKTFAKKKISYAKILEHYNQFLEDNNLSENTRVIIDKRTYENHAQACDYILWNFNRQLRYYNIFENDYSEFVNALCLEKYKDLEISTLKIYRDNEKLMWEYDIHDEFELHNLLKKIWDKYGNCEVTFHKMPTLIIGNADRDRQVKDLLMKYAPISNDDFGARYEEKYGAKAATVLANYVDCIQEYFHNGVYAVDYEKMSDEQFGYMKKSLTEDFYMLSDVEEIFKTKFKDENMSLINAYNIKNLGYKIYCDYVVKNCYPSAKEFFRKMLTKENIVDTREEVWAKNSIVLYFNALYDLLYDRTIVEFEPKQYINISKLNEKGITKEMIDDYCEKAFDFAQNEDYFTIKSIRDNGFSHELDSFGFDDCFYSSLLAFAQKNFSYRKMGGNRLFLCGEKAVSLGSFLEYVLEEKEQIGIVELESYLAQKYDVRIDRYKLAEAIKGTNLYYDSVEAKVYRNYNLYLNR